MLTIVGPYPTKENERDGMVRRVAKIDECFQGEKRQYLAMSFRGPFFKRKKVNDDLTVYWMNFFAFWWYAFILVMKSQMVYVHSIYNSLNIFPAYLFHKNIITDMHGVVVEEIKMNRKHGRLFILIGTAVFRFIEYVAINNSTNIICVTNNMKKYFVNLYHINSDKAKVLPIFDQCDIQEKSVWGKPLRAIYSGGIQPWQCIDETIQFIKKTAEVLHWTILSSNPDYFKKRLQDVKFKYGIEIKSVSPDQVGIYYQNSDLGIVLRDDSIVNRVACPTKLIDYLTYGLIPIVKSPQIGDFFDKGYNYVDIRDDDFEDFKQKSLDSLSSISMKNESILAELTEQAHQSIIWLKVKVNDKRNAR